MKAAPDRAEMAAALREALHRAGPDGVKPAGLRLSGKTPTAVARRAALAALLADGRVAGLGTGAAARYFLAEHAPTAETVGARLLAVGAFVPGTLNTPPALWKETALRRQRPLLSAALAGLTAERHLVPLRQGKSTLLAFAAPLRAWLGEEAVHAAPPLSVPVSVEAPDNGALFAAYARLVRESGGFPDVKIAGLRRALGDAAADLPDRLAALWREGRATLSLGDWSLADETTRAAAVELAGEKYLLVRLDG